MSDHNSKAARARRLKLQRQQIKKLTDNYYIVNSPVTNPKGVFICDGDGDIRKIDQHATRGFLENPIKWRVTGFYIGKSEWSEYYVTPFDLPFSEPVAYKDIARLVGTKIEESVKKGTNPRHRVATAWIARGDFQETSTEMADKIFTQIGLYDKQARWEKDLEQDV